MGDAERQSRNVKIVVEEADNTSGEEIITELEQSEINNRRDCDPGILRRTSCLKSNLALRNPRKVLPQLLVTAVGSLGFFCTGAIRGWSSYGAPSLNQTRNFDMDASDFPWLSCLPMAGAVVGALLVAFPLETCGRRKTLTWHFIFYILGFLVIGFTYFGRHKAMLYVGRILTGVGTGMTTPSCQTYVSECSSPSIKSRLGSLSASSLALGILVTYTIGAFVEWYVLSWILGVLPIIFLICTAMMPETPAWLLMHDREDEARESLRRLRGKETDIEDELIRTVERLERNKSFNNKPEQRARIRLRELMVAPVLKPLCISLCIMFFRQATGINAIVCYTVVIFNWSGTTFLDGRYATIILGLVQFVFTVISGFVFLACFGRRSLLIASSFFMALSLAAAGTFFHFRRQWGVEEADRILGWVPLVSLMMFFAAFSVGYSNIPFIIMGEMFPARFRALLGTVSSISNFMFAFVVLRFFPSLVFNLGKDGTFFIFTVCTFLSIGFAYWFVPETKGRTLEEMEQHFSPQTHVATSVV